MAMIIGDTDPPELWNLSPPDGTDTVATTQNITFSLVDARGVAQNRGVDLGATTVTALVTGSAAEVVYDGQFRTGWDTLSVVTVETVGGYTGSASFSLVHDGVFPDNSDITITIVTTNDDGFGTTYVPTYTVIPVLGISSISIVGVSRIRLGFTLGIKSGDVADLQTPSNWSVRPIPGNAVHSADNTSFVKAVYVERRFNPRYVILDVQPLVPNQRYEVAATGFSDILARDFDGSGQVAGEARRTKEDAVLEGLPPMWGGRRVSNVFWVLAAIAEQDEIIGGSQGIVLASPLDRNF